MSRNDKMLIEAKEFMQIREKQLLDEMMQEIQQRLDILFDDNNTNQTHNIIHLLQMANYYMSVSLTNRS